MDDNPYEASKASKHDLRNALDALLAGRTPPVESTNPIGCNVKWKDQDCALDAAGGVRPGAEGVGGRIGDAEEVVAAR